MVTECTLSKGILRETGVWVREQIRMLADLGFNEGGVSGVQIPNTPKYLKKNSRLRRAEGGFRGFEPQNTPKISRLRRAERGFSGF